MQLLGELQDVYSHYKYDFGVVDIPIHSTLKPDAELKKQRITKTPKHYSEKVQKILVELATDGTIEGVGLDVA